MELDMDIVVTGKRKIDLMNLQKLIRAKNEEGRNCVNLEKVYPCPKGLKPVPFDRNSWTEEEWKVSNENMAKCGSESDYFWRIDNWGTTHAMIHTNGLYGKDLIYDVAHDNWKMELSMNENILPVLEKLANRFPMLDFVVTIFERDGVSNNHYEYRLKRAFYNSLLQSSDSMGREYEEKESVDGVRVVTRDNFAEITEGEEPSEENTEEKNSANGDFEDVEIPM